MISDSAKVEQKQAFRILNNEIPNCLILTFFYLGSILMFRNSSMPYSSFIAYTEKGIVCTRSGIYIDPLRKVEQAIITHAHADHARPGMGKYICHPYTAAVLKYRLGKKIKVECHDYGEVFRINGVEFSLHPAGHAPGSAQVRMASDDEVWVVTGDFKLEDDGLTTPFELVKCDGIIMESTFALPVYRWKPQQVVLEEIRKWWRMNSNLGRFPVIMAYSFGKAQRLVYALHKAGIPFAVHKNIESTNQVLRNAGMHLPECDIVDETSDPDYLRGKVLLLPAFGNQRKWQRMFGDMDYAMVSGWMQLKGSAKSGPGFKGFVLSDHADWDGLNHVAESSGAKKVIVGHGYEEVFVRWLKEKEVDAYSLSTLSSEGKGGKK